MGLLRVTVEEHGEVTARGARLHVQVEAETFVLGNAAVNGAREVRELVAALRAAGVTDADVHVQGVRIAGAGSVVRAQKATYSLSVDAAPGTLPDVLGAVASSRHAQLSHLEWLYEDFEASLPLLERAMRRARRKADVIAGAAGQRVLGVHSASDSWQMPSTTVDLRTDSAVMARTRSAMLDVGVEFSATRTLEVELTVDFTLQRVDDATNPV